MDRLEARTSGTDPAERTTEGAPGPRPGRGRRLRRIALLVLAAIAIGGIGYWWWQRSQPALPPGIAAGNGRLEADEVDIDTRLAGRIRELRAEEGDMVKQGQVLAVMDTRELEAQQAQAAQMVAQASRSLDRARTAYAAQQAVAALAETELGRSAYLVPKGYATRQMLDQQRQALATARATLKGDADAIEAARHAVEAARHQMDYYTVQIADATLTAPVSGPIEARLARAGEVVPAGGRVFAMLDAHDLYMDIYLPTAEAGRVRLGSPARVVLDAYPGQALAARVVFVAKQAQFTPKTVETRDERARLMFRVRVRLTGGLPAEPGGFVRSGLPGEAYVRTSADAAWPARLAGQP